MRRALEETVVDGIDTTLAFHIRVLDDENFRKGEIHTGFIEEFLTRERAAAA
jgi:acetyl-CoA carboxylase biotin carboxylase subunit